MKKECFGDKLVAWEGKLCQVGVCSRKSPTGARGHRVIITEEGAQLMCRLAIGKPLRSKHAPRIREFFQPSEYVVGIILEAEVLNGWVVLRGVYCPPPVADIAASSNSLGMSYEIEDIFIDDLGAEEWPISKFKAFAGAIYNDISLVAHDSRFKEVEL